MTLLSGVLNGIERQWVPQFTLDGKDVRVRWGANRRAERVNKWHLTMLSRGAVRLTVYMTDFGADIFLADIGIREQLKDYEGRVYGIMFDDEYVALGRLGGWPRRLGRGDVIGAEFKFSVEAEAAFQVWRDELLERGWL